MVQLRQLLKWVKVKELKCFGKQSLSLVSSNDRSEGTPYEGMGAGCERKGSVVRVATIGQLTD